MLEFIKEKWPELLVIALIGALWIAITVYTADPRLLMPAHQPRADSGDNAAMVSLAQSDALPAGQQGG